MILLCIQTRIRNYRATDPDPGGQLITDPLDLTWTFLWALTKISCQIGSKSLNIMTCWAFSPKFL
jgi:hypothetical protein